MVDLSELVHTLRFEVNPPGTDLFEGAEITDWVNYLIGAFWDLRLNDLLNGFEEDAASRGGPAPFGMGIITPLKVEEGYDEPDGYNPKKDLSREQQQLIVLWAGWRIVLNKFLDIKTTFRARAGSVEYETQQSASALRGLLDIKREQIKDVLRNLQAGGRTEILDAIVERDYYLARGDTWWVR